MSDLYRQLKVLEQDGRQMERSDRLKALPGPLLEWYQSHARVLPWRENPEPYRVWISEIMLQQTRVEAVKPYFERFLAELPTIEALAAVEEERLFKLWEGLGYYNRAKNLKKAAIKAVEEYDGKLPASYEELKSFPGIGSYTAGAIASIAYGIPVPAVDGNVLRVISRVLASREDVLKEAVKRQMERELLEVIPAAYASAFNQGLIEIGAIVCIPNGQPRCTECPFDSVCLAKRHGLIGEIPVKTPKKARKIEKRTVILLEHCDRIGLRKRPDQGLLASLYELPNIEGWCEETELPSFFHLEDCRIEAIEELPPAKHVFSHVEWHMKGYRILLKEDMPECYIDVDKQEIKTRYPLPNAFRAYIQQIK